MAVVAAVVVTDEVREHSLSKTPALLVVSRRKPRRTRLPRPALPDIVTRF